MDIHIESEGDLEEVMEYIHFHEELKKTDGISLTVTAPSMCLLGEFARCLLAKQDDPKYIPKVDVQMYLYVPVVGTDVDDDGSAEGGTK